MGSHSVLCSSVGKFVALPPQLLSTFSLYIWVYSGLSIACLSTEIWLVLIVLWDSQGFLYVWFGVDIIWGKFCLKCFFHPFSLSSAVHPNRHVLGICSTDLGYSVLRFFVGLFQSLFSWLFRFQVPIDPQAQRFCPHPCPPVCSQAHQRHSYFCDRF